MKQLSERLKRLESRGRLRALNLPLGIDLTSNDYLGMAAHPALRDAAIEFLQKGGDIGAAGSRLLRGHTKAHADLEDYAAVFFAAEKTLYFSSGFQANAALFQALPARGDTIIFDALIHASAREGIQNSLAQHIRVAHNDLEGFEAALKKAKGQKWIAVESVYSMDGDFAPLADLYDLACRYDAMLIVDEAHASGVYGAGGRGMSANLIAAHGYERIITLHTCGKAIGVAGGLVCSNAAVIDTLINSARGFIYSTAPLPLQAFLVQKSLEILGDAEGDRLREKLFVQCRQAQNLFGGAGSPIVPIIIGDDTAAIFVAKNLQQKGYDVRAIRPPTVPEGTARLRVSLSAALAENTLENFAAVLTPLLQGQAA
jgi:8-amino-7-oxononanoate synthase